jgi:histone deacetylase 11
MYWQIDAACYFAGIIGCIYSSVTPTSSFWVGFGYLAWIWLYPLILECICNLIATHFSKFTSFSIQTQCKIVYHSKYNINLWGMEKYHSFDTYKFQKISETIHEKMKESFIKPSQLPRSFLLEKMSKVYLLKLCYGFYIIRLIELPLWFIPAWILRWRILNPMLLATEGSILAACIALQSGWAINLSGGFHHASFDRGGGFCVYPDISLVVQYLQSRLGMERIMIIDLDAHQGNGYQRDFVLQENVYIVDCYNYRIYPNDG